MLGLYQFTQTYGRNLWNAIYIWPLENAKNYSEEDTNLYMCMYIYVYQMFNLIKTYIHPIVLRLVKTRKRYLLFKSYAEINVLS